MMLFSLSKEINQSKPWNMVGYTERSKMETKVNIISLLSTICNLSLITNRRQGTAFPLFLWNTFKVLRDEMIAYKTESTLIRLNAI
jgi:hypothetical protein